MNKLRFLHIPKTAGTTFTHILIRQYGEENHFQFTGDNGQDLGKFAALTAEKQASLLLYSGHAPISTGNATIDALPIVTFLREPIARVQSFCQHVAEGKSPYLLEKFQPDNFNLDEFLSSETLELQNLQTKMLINQGRCEMKIELNSEQALAKAWANLIHKTTFGLVEYFDQSLILMQQKFRWEMPLYRATNQKNPNKLIVFKDHHIEKITQLNQLDLHLYAQAKAHFVELINNREFNKKVVKKLQKLNHYRDIGKLTFEQKIALLRKRFSQS